MLLEEDDRRIKGESQPTVDEHYSGPPPIGLRLRRDRWIRRVCRLSLRTVTLDSENGSAHDGTQRHADDSEDWAVISWICSDRANSDGAAFDDRSAESRFEPTNPRRAASIISEAAPARVVVHGREGRLCQETNFVLCLPFSRNPVASVWPLPAREQNSRTAQKGSQEGAAWSGVFFRPRCPPRGRVLRARTRPRSR
jgi:hypothetical protein